MSLTWVSRALLWLSCCPAKTGSELTPVPRPNPPPRRPPKPLLHPRPLLKKPLSPSAESRLPAAAEPQSPRTPPVIGPFPTGPDLSNPGMFYPPLSLFHCEDGQINALCFLCRAAYHHLMYRHKSGLCFVLALELALPVLPGRCLSGLLFSRPSIVGRFAVFPGLLAYDSPP